jgi:hypothetical protein
VNKRVQDKEKLNDANLDTGSETARWTSGVYEVQFGQIALIEPIPDQRTAFQMNAWGLSKDLRELLADYSDTQVHRAIEWVLMQQTALIVNMLEHISMEGGFMPPLEHLFISLDTELFLPRGLRMLVTCITNIVPRGDEDDSLDKFVAVLDPSEALTYVEERRGLSNFDSDERIH